MRLQNLTDIEFYSIMYSIEENDLRLMISSDQKNRKFYLAFFKTSKVDKITKSEIIKYVEKFVYANEINKFLHNEIARKIAQFISEVDKDKLINQAISIIDESIHNESSDEKNNDLEVMKGKFNSLEFILGFDACLRFLCDALVEVPSVSDVDLELLASLIQGVGDAEVFMRILESKNIIIETPKPNLKDELSEYKKTSQKEIRGLKKELKEVKKELSIANQRLIDKNKLSSIKFLKLNGSVDIKSMILDLEITENDSFVSTWVKVTKEEEVLIRKVNSPDKSILLTYDRLSKLLALKYIILRLKQGGNGDE